ncbi:MAG: PspC domain-containing protein [Clostridiales bacterium]|nr:PspC domain-containing protein [Clostridiales bacterium]
MSGKKLVRPRDGRKVSGVCLGIADYIGIDAAIVRILWVVGTLIFFGAGILLYIACIFIIPEDDNTIDVDFTEK